MISVVGTNTQRRRNAHRGRRETNGTISERERAAKGAPSILRKLDGDDRRSIGRSNQIASEVIENPQLFNELFDGMLEENSAVVRLRAADAVEKITRQRPEYLRRHKRRLIVQLARTNQPGVRWHIAQMLPRLNLTRKDLPRVLDILQAYLNDPSRIVATSAMQALADLTKRFPHLLPSVLPELRVRTAVGTAAMKARGRKLLAELEKMNSQCRDKR